MIRGGHLDLCVPGVKGMGGAMDLFAGARRVVMRDHVNKAGAPKSLENCTLPPGKRVVHEIVTELAYFVVKPEGGLPVTKIATGVTLDEVREKTKCGLEVAEPVSSMA